MKTIDELVKGMNPNGMITIHDDISLTDACYISARDAVESVAQDSTTNDKRFKEIVAGIKTQLGQNRALVARADATHYGFINRNFSYYDMKFIKQNSATWIEQTPTGNYGKPVQKDHDLSTDSTLGRVIQGSPIIYKQANSDLYVPDGHIELIYYVTDAKAIEMVIDGRMKTLSVSASTSPSTVKCSICGNSVISDACTHIRGREYERDEEDTKARSKKGKELCYWVWGPKTYKEVSYVQAPADASAAHKEVCYINIDGKDAEDNIIRVSDKPLVSPKIFLMTGLVEQDSISSLQDAFGTPVQNDYHIESKIPVPPVTPDPLPPKPDTTCPACQDTAPSPIPDVLSQTPDQTIALGLLTDIMTTGYIDPTDAIAMAIDFCGLVIKMEKPTAKDIIDIFNAELERRDAALTAEKRNKLRDSTFCGPDRSWPVPDCKHVQVARSYLSNPRVTRKYSSDQLARIRACVNRKAQSLGCDKTKAKDFQQEEPTVAKYTFDSVEELLASEPVKHALDEQLTSNEQALDKITKDAAAKEQRYKAIAIDSILDLSLKLKKPQVSSMLGKDGEEFEQAKSAIVAKMSDRSIDVLCFQLDEYRVELLALQEAEKTAPQQPSAADSKSQAAVQSALDNNMPAGQQPPAPSTQPDTAGTPATVVTATDGVTPTAPVSTPETISQPTNNGQPESKRSSILATFSRPVKQL